MTENPSAPLQVSTHPLASLRERLVQARYQRDWSQQELADLLGTTPLNVSRWERSLTTPNSFFRHKLCQIFELTEIELGLRPDPSLLPSPMQKGRETLAAFSPPLYDPFLPLPAGVPLVGRSFLLNQLKHLLQSNRTVALSALHGLPGVGKTALALELAYDPELREIYPDGLLWAALGPQPNVLGILSHWGKLLGINEDEAVRLGTQASWTRTLRATIGNRRFLFVLDDAWHLEHALACQVGGAQCGYVLTTRLPQVAQGFTSIEACLVEALEEEQSLELLRQLAPWALSQAQEQMRPLVQAVGGLPLALSLMGHYLRLQTHDRQPRRLQAALGHLQDRFSRLQLAQPRAPGETRMGGQISLQAIITISSEHLSQQAHQTWEALSILPARPNSFSEAAALAVSEASAQILDELSDAGLLEAVGPARYSFHQTIADYGRAQLSASAQQEALRRLITYSQHYAETNSTNYHILEQEASVLTTALESCASLSEQESLLRLTLKLTPFWKAYGDYRQAEQWLARAEVAAQTLGRGGDEAQVKRFQGDVIMQQGGYEQALLYYEQALTLARQVGEAEQICDSLIKIIRIAYRRGQYEQVEQILPEGLELARQQGLIQQQAASLLMLGLLKGHRGEAEQELAHTLKGLMLAQQVGDYELCCSLFINLGAHYVTRGDFGQAAHYYQEGLALTRQQGYRHWEGFLLASLGLNAIGQGDQEQAEHYSQEALRIARLIGNVENICDALIQLGDITMILGKYEQAEHITQEGLSLARQLGNRVHITRGLTNLGMISSAWGEYRQAEQHLREALSLAQDIGDNEQIRVALLYLGEVTLTSGKYDQAEQALQEGLHLTHQEKNPFYIGMFLNIIGEVALARGDYEQAEQDLQEALSIFRPFGVIEHTAKMVTSLGALALARGDYEQAENCLQEGLHLIRQRHSHIFLCPILYQWATLSLLRGQLEEAATAFQEILVIAPKGARAELAQARYGLARVALAQGKKAETLQLGQVALTTLETIGHREAIEVRQWLDRLEQEL